VIITKKVIDRRTILRGIGTALALPLLDGMVPALSAATKPANRLGAVYVPNGIMMQNWTPLLEGSAFDFSPTLKPLEPFRDHLLVLSGLNSIPPPDGDPNDTHPKASTRFLTDVPPKPTRGADLHAGISMDQIAAKELGQYTQLGSLELALESSESAGTCSAGFSCAYTSTISWLTPTTPLPMEHDPRAVFERMFGDNPSANSNERRARMQTERSILDSVIEKIGRLEQRLGPSDRAKLGEYLESIRDAERRIQKAEEQNSVLPAMDHPQGVPGKFEDHANLMYDLMALAYQCDMTRIVTFMIGREQSGRTFPELGIPDAHHAISHHQNDPVKLAKLAKINTYHLTLFTRLLDKLQRTADGDGSLLDHAMIVYGAGMSNGNGHDPRNLPILLLGGGCGQLKSGWHITFPKDTPLANLHLTLLDKLGVRVQSMGDSSGKFDQLSAVS
jgi:Protein of unknown function (DUF1552)